MPVTTKVESYDHNHHDEQEQNVATKRGTILERPSIKNRLLLVAPENSLDTDTTWDSTDLDVGAEDVRHPSYSGTTNDDRVDESATRLEAADEGLARRVEQQQQQQQVAATDELELHQQQQQQQTPSKQQLANDDADDVQALHLHKFNADLPAPFGVREENFVKMRTASGQLQQHEDAGDDDEKRLSVYENVVDVKTPTVSKLLPAWPPPQSARFKRDSGAWEADELDVVPAKPARPTKQNQPTNCDDENNSKTQAKKCVAERRLVSMLSITMDPNDQLMFAHSSSPTPQEEPQVQPCPTATNNSDPNNNKGSLVTLLEEDDDSGSFGAVVQNRQRLLARFEPPKVSDEMNKRPAKSGAFVDGKGAASSRVKRLAQTFEAAASQAAATVRDETQQQDDESEVSNSWYDAEQLDEQEVAKFLEEFDVSAARSVSTGADPFVTLADSTLADEGAGAGGGADDDTLNELDDEDDDDDQLDGEDALQNQAEVEQGKVAREEAESWQASAASASASDAPDSERQVNRGDDGTTTTTTTNSSAAVSIIELPIISTPSKQADNVVDEHIKSLTTTSNQNKPTNVFRANLSELIGRQSQSQSLSQNQSQNQTQTQNQTQVETNANVQEDKMEPQKELKGLTRYYRAILSSRHHRRHHHKQRRKPLMEDYIHSGSSSSGSESDNDNENENENESNGAEETTRLKVPNNRRLVKDAKKCSRLYEELERLLAKRRRWADEGARCRPICEDEEDLDLEEEEEEEEESISGDPDQVSLSSSSAVSYESIPELKHRQNLQKLYNIVREIHSSEEKFVDTLRLLNVDFRQHMAPLLDSQQAQHKQQLEAIRGLLRHLPQLQALNENLLAELEKAAKEWPKSKKIAHVLVKMGPFLKHYSTYIREFDSLQMQLNDSLKKWPQLEELVKRFEASDRCQRLSVQHHLLRPIQRIPQYRLLLQQYLQHLKPDDADYEDTVEALEVVSRVAEHANQSMSEGANFSKLLALQAKIVHKQRDLVQPGRRLVKEGELMKVCRKQKQPRYFVLLNDALLYLTQIQSSDILYLNNELSLDECRVSASDEQNQSLVGQQFATEFSVCAKTRSFQLVAKSREERDDWLGTLRRTIDEHLARRRSFSVSATTTNNTMVLADQSNVQNQNERLGQQAPLWTPDSRVTMCQLCTSTFSALFRRHHCRACGRVVCSACSNNQAPLVYLKCRPARVCDLCFRQLKANLQLYYSLHSPGSQQALAEDEQLRRLDDNFRTLLRSQFVRGKLVDWPAQLHLGLARPKSSLSLAPSAAAAASSQLRQLGANDLGSSISGYLHRRHPSKAKWKRQWFVIRDKVLYAFRAIDDVAPASSLPLLGFQVHQPKRPIDGLDARSLLQLVHVPSHRTAPNKEGEKDDDDDDDDDDGLLTSRAQIVHLFKAESVGAAERWLEALASSVVLD